MQAPWGYSLSMDLIGCDPATIRSKQKIQEYVIQLCKLIDMKRHGDVMIEHFGSGNKEGFTMVQLIETSNVTAHFANDIECAFIDLFSCKEFNANEVASFTKEFFSAANIGLQLIDRGAAHQIMKRD